MRNGRKRTLADNSVPEIVRNGHDDMCSATRNGDIYFKFVIGLRVTVLNEYLSRQQRNRFNLYDYLIIKRVTL